MFIRDASAKYNLNIVNDEREVLYKRVHGRALNLIKIKPFSDYVEFEWLWSQNRETEAISRLLYQGLNAHN